MSVFDDDEAEEIADDICPHCRERIGGESAGAALNSAYHHLICMQPSADRVGEVVPLLHRLSNAELGTVEAEIRHLLAHTKWSR